jgi:pyruvate/2-oxoglutarate/acetoin dehydrogenase E1 component
LEKLFLGIPGLNVVAPNTLGDPGALLQAAIADNDPVLFVEHKLLYTRPLLESGRGDLVEFEIEKSGKIYPNYILRIPNHIPQLTIASYGYNFELARAAALELLMEHEIFSELILFSQLSPIDLDPLFDALKKTRKLLTIEEGTLSLGWGAEVITRVVEGSSDSNSYKFRRVAARDLPIANSRILEEAILPSVDDIVQSALSLVS